MRSIDARLALAALSLSSALGCATPSTRPVAPPAAKATTAAAPSDDDATLPAPSAPPSWLEREAGCGAKDCDVLPSFFASRLDRALAVRSRGEKVALVRTALGLFAHHRERGVLGPLRTPGAKPPEHVGLGTGDEVFVVDEEGRVHHAPDVGAALLGFAARGKVGKAIAWDFVPGTIVAATESTVHVSTDGGVTFVEAPPPAKVGKIHTVLTRPDGVVVVGGAEVFVSRDRGKTWAPSVLHGSDLSRLGSHLRICSKTLAADGVQWVEPPQHAFDADAWVDPFVLAHEAQGVALPKLWTVLEPAMPFAPKPLGPIETMGVGCSGGLPGQLPKKTVKIAPMLLGFSPFGLKALAAEPLGPKPTPTRSTHLFVGDGACAAGTAVNHECTSSFARAPHLLRLDRVGPPVRLFAPPPGCEPVKVLDAMGAGLVACRGGGSTVSLALVDGGGFAAQETPRTFTVEALDARAMADDGTLAVPSPGGLAVRTAYPLGTRGAFRTVSIAGTLAYRVGPRGQAIAVVAKGADSTSFDLVRDEPGKAPRVLARDVEVRGGIAAVSGRSDGTVEVIRHAMTGERETLTFGP